MFLDHPLRTGRSDGGSVVLVKKMQDSLWHPVARKVTSALMWFSNVSTLAPLGLWVTFMGRNFVRSNSLGRALIPLTNHIYWTVLTMVFAFFRNPVSSSTLLNRFLLLCIFFSICFIIFYKYGTCRVFFPLHKQSNFLSSFLMHKVLRIWKVNLKNSWIKYSISFVL